MDNIKPGWRYQRGSAASSAPRSLAALTPETRSPSIPHRFSGNSGLTIRAVDSGRGRQGRREEGRTQASSHRFFLGQSKQGFPGSFLSGEGYFGRTQRPESKELCAVLMARKRSSYFLLSVSQKGEFIVFAPSRAGWFSSTAPVRRKETWRCRGGLCRGGKWDLAWERQPRNTETLS